MKTKSFIAALLLAASSAFAQVPSYVPANGLVGWWPFNGNANDESGNGHNGTPTIGISFTLDRFGNSNKSCEFSGGANKVSVPNSPQFAMNDFTISVWMKSTYNLQHEAGLVTKNVTGGYPAYWIYINHIGQGLADLYVTQIGGAQAAVLSQTVINDGQWHHILVTRISANGQMSIFVDGVLSATNTGPSGQLSINDELLFGETYNGDNQDNYYGKLDDIAIYNRVITQQEITALYNAQSCNSTSNTITADGPTTFCAGNYVNLTSDVMGGTYQWKKNGVNITTSGTSRTYKATATGSYTCVATCNGTALTSNAIAVTSKTNAAATVSASGATSFCAGDSVTLNATNLGSNYSVQWYRTNVSMENATNYSQVVKQPGTYKVVTRNLTNGCSRISGSAITTNVNCRIAGDVTSGAVIQENTNVDSRFIDNELSQGVHIYPNPNSGVFSFNYDGEETGDAVLQIINNMGQSIYQSRLTVPEGGFTQDLQLGDNITKGIYIVRLLINDSYHDSKVMVK
jgi:hypothetical protein